MSQGEEKAGHSRRTTKSDTILAKGKVAAMVIGAVATAITAVWGAVRQPSEPGAKVAYEVLREALQQERDRHNRLEDEIDELRHRTNGCTDCDRIMGELRNSMLRSETISRNETGAGVASASPYSAPTAVPSASPESDKDVDGVVDERDSSSKVHGVSKGLPKLPTAEEIGL